MRLVAITSSDHLEAGIVCHDVRNPAQRSEVLVRKGSALSADQVRALLERGIDELHLALPDPEDVPEDEAAQRLAAAVAGPGADFSEAHHGQVSFHAARRGMLRVNRPALDRVNDVADVLLLTALPDRPVDSGMSLGVVKCAPLFISERRLRSVEAFADTVLEVEPFQPLRVGLVAPRERLRGGAFERARAALSTALEWYGSSLDCVVDADATVEGLASAYRQVLGQRVDLVLAAGATGTDPLDVVFEGLRQAGGEVVQIGIPAEPGTACWIGCVGTAPVLGLASCELFGRPGALDLLLPAVHVGAALDGALVRHLALGGLLLGPSRIAPYHSSKGLDG